MVSKTHEVLTSLAQKTSDVLLFHSANGKDSIVLLDFLCSYGFRVKPVFMYVVKGLEQHERYITWAEKQYKVKFERVPHYALPSYIRQGYMGIKKDKECKLLKLSDIRDSLLEMHGLEYSVLGFKKTDSLQRRIMLNELPDLIHPKSKVCYPIADWKQSEVLQYIKSHRLPVPVAIGNHTSNDTFIDDPNYLTWCKKHYPEDFRKIASVFPETEALLYAHDEAKRNEDN